MDNSFTVQNKYLRECKAAVQSALNTRDKYGQHKNIHLILSVFFAILQLAVSFYLNKFQPGSTSTIGSKIAVSTPGSLLFLGFLGLYIRAELNYQHHNQTWENWKLLLVILSSPDCNQASVSQIVNTIFAETNSSSKKKRLPSLTNTSTNLSSAT